MKIRMLEGEDQINAALMGAMESTVRTLASRGLIDADEAERFLDENICLAVAKDGPFLAWLKRRFGADVGADKIVVAHVGSRP